AGDDRQDAVFAALRPPQTEGKCHEYLTEAARDRGALDRHDNSRSGPSPAAVPEPRKLPSQQHWTLPRLSLAAGVLRHRQVRGQLEGSRSGEATAAAR